MNKDEMFRVGVIASTHGVKGEVKVFPTTDDPRRYDILKKVYLDTKKELLELNISGVKYFKKFVIVKFKEFDNINDIEKYKSMDLLIERKDAVPLEEGEFYISDLLGLSVITDDDKELGILKDVLQTGANDVYVVEDKNKNEILLPVIKECILKVDLEKKIVMVHLMEGLI